MVRVYIKIFLNFVPGHGFSERSDKALNDYKQLLLKESKSLTEWSKKLQKIYEEENSDEENEATSGKTSVQKLALFEISFDFLIMSCLKYNWLLECFCGNYHQDVHCPALWSYFI